MPGEGPPLPTTFPCLCRAIYSWSGETKRDLGFVEGDLIICLNAGDGQWWMGRLKRNKNSVGLFPSNFVEVLQDQLPPSRPVSRNGPSRPVSRNGNSGQMYGGGGGSVSRAVSPGPQMYSRAPSPQPSMHDYDYDYRGGRSPSPNPHHQGHYSRATSPAPPPHQGHYSRAASPAPPPHRDEYYSRAPSPAPPRHQDHYSRASSPNPYGRSASPNPYSRAASPAPTTGREEYMRRATSPAPSHYRGRGASPPSSMVEHQHRATSPNPYMRDGRREERAPQPPPPPTHRYARGSSPVPPQHGRRTPDPSRGPSPAMLGNTPSPLRNAMEDVMESLEHMTTIEDDDPRPIDPWSPEAFGQQYHPSPKKFHGRPETSMGISGRNDYDMDDNDRMEDRLRRFQLSNHPSERYIDEQDIPPPTPLKNSSYGEHIRPKTGDPSQSLRNRKSIYDMPANKAGISRSPSPNKTLRTRPLSRTTTIKSSTTTSNQSTTTNGTNSTSGTSVSLMSGLSAGGFSATSAGSLAKRKLKAISMVEGGGGGLPARKFAIEGFGNRSETPSERSESAIGGRSTPNILRRGQTWAAGEPASSGAGVLGGLTAPKPKKTGFLKKILNSAKTSTASARSIAAGSGTSSPAAAMYAPKTIPDGLNAIGGGRNLQQSQDWVQVRRDVNRSNTLSRNERIERQERQQLMDQLVLRPVDALDEDVDGDEAADGGIVENPQDFDAGTLSLVDKTARFVNNLPPFTTPESLASHHVCRPYRSDVQRLRAIFTWVSEKIAWEHSTGPIEGEIGGGGDRGGGINTKKVIANRRGSSEEVAVVVFGMCDAVGIPCQVVQGYLKAPGEALDVESSPRANHFWNTVLVDGEWRIMDCSLASPTHPRRVMYSSAPPNSAELFYFLTRPSYACWTHIPFSKQHQHLVPPLPMAILLALPCACPMFFKHELQMISFDTSLTRIEDLEVVQIEFSVPADVECVAEVEARGFAVDQDGDVFESGEVIKKRALAQVCWESGVKVYRVKAVLPGDEGQGVLKVYAGRRGLMHSIKDNPHSLAFALPISHAGENPPYDFLLRHPTPHAQRHDLYISQPQCSKLAVNNTFVFAVRQSPSEGMLLSPTLNGAKPAKLAIQTPSGKILRLMKKADTIGCQDGMTWETIIKCGERGPWRALVLADRSARWCVYAEWTVV